MYNGFSYSYYCTQFMNEKTEHKFKSEPDLTAASRPCPWRAQQGCTWKDLAQEAGGLNSSHVKQLRTIIPGSNVVYTYVYTCVYPIINLNWDCLQNRVYLIEQKITNHRSMNPHQISERNSYENSINRTTMLSVALQMPVAEQPLELEKTRELLMKRLIQSRSHYPLAI